MASNLGKFKPWQTPDGRSPQREFIQAAATHKIRIFRAGNRGGKTTCGAWDAAAIACDMHPFYQKTGPTRGWVIGVDWGQGIAGVIWPKLKSFLVPSMIQEISYLRRSAPEIPLAVRLKNGSEILFRSAEAGREKLQGQSLDWAWIDEEIEAGLVEEIRARLLDRGGHLSVTLTPISRMAWVADLEGQRDKHGTTMCKVVRASMRDAAEAGILDMHAVESYLANLPERQRRVRELGDFAALEGMVYPEFNRTDHCLTPKDGGLYDSQGKWVASWPLPKDWPRYAAMDFGFTVPSAVVILCVDPYTDHWIVERCLYANGIRASRWGEELRRDLLPKLTVPLITDHDAMARAELVAAGVPTCAAKKANEKTPGIESVQRALMPLNNSGRPHLQFVLAPDATAPRNALTGRDDCHHLIWELERYRYAEKKETGPDVKDEPIKRDDHAMDALRYLVHFLERRNQGDPLPMPIKAKELNPIDDLAPPSPWQ